MKNKTIRTIMQMLYGKECFIEKLGIRICGAKTLDHTINYHHIVPVEQLGKTTIQNGALIARYNHDWFHQQPLYVQDELNEMFQEYKNSCKFARIVVREDGTIDFEALDETLLQVPAPIKVYDNRTLTADEIRKLKYIRSQRDYLEGR